MRILIVHNRYQQKGGEDTVVAAEDQLLRSHGHHVERFDADNEHIQDLFSRVKSAVGSVYSFSAKRKMQDLLGQVRPDMVHVHNFFPTLSPSIFVACSDAHVPVVHTLHNYRIQCAAATLFREGRICEECVETRSFLPGIQHACYRSSRFGSAISGFGMALHAEMGTWQSRVSAYIALTEFAADKLGAFRIPRHKIFVKPNFVVDRGVGEGEGDYALFVGRLSPEKGLQTLIDADQSGSLCMDVWVLGDGPMRAEVERAAARPGSRLKVRGFADRDEIIRRMKSARVLLMTSLWYEAGLPLVAIEALSVGLPLIATDVGSTAAILRQTGAGLLFHPGDALSLAAVLRQYANDPSSWQKMRQNARSCYVSAHTPEQNYQRLIEIYAHAQHALAATGA